MADAAPPKYGIRIDIAILVRIPLGAGEKIAQTFDRKRARLDSCKFWRNVLCFYILVKIFAENPRF
jgi:hypothetical protein